MDLARLSESLGLVTLDKVALPLMIETLAGEVAYANPAALELSASFDTEVTGGSQSLPASPRGPELDALRSQALAEIGTVFSGDHSMVDRRNDKLVVHHVRCFAVTARDGTTKFVVWTFRDVSMQRLTGRLLQIERQVQGLLLDEAALFDVLTALARGYESIFPGLLCSILRLEASTGTLHTVAAPGLPPAYCAAIEGTPIGEHAGSCGTAAYTGKPVIVTDIATDPRWARYKDIALAHDLHACWSIPIFSRQRVVVGTFAMYHRHRVEPSEDQLSIVTAGAELAGLAFETTLRKRRIDQQRQVLRDALTYQSAVLDNMSDGVITIDDHGHVMSYNKAAERIFQWTRDETLGRNVSMLMPSPHREQHDHYIAHYRDTGIARVVGIAREVDGQRKDGSTIPISLSVAAVRSENTVTFVGIVRDITRRRADEEEIRRLAYYDPLTNLPNRRLLFDRLKQATLTSARTGQHGALLFLDLDHFKELNDSLGHSYGDELLKSVAKRLLHAVREGDSVARLGGDEYVVLIESLNSDMAEAARQADGVARKVMHALVQPYTLFGHDYHCTPSVGIALFLEAHEGLDDIVKKADAAMYQAKAAGRNAIRFFDAEMQAALSRRTVLERELRQAIAQDEFLLYFQRQVDTLGHTIGAEALVRWCHPKSGIVGPGTFIPLAEQSGQIVLIGNWIIREACRELKSWERHEVRRNWTLAVNVSAMQFAQSDFVEIVRNALSDSGACADRLKLELTESMVVGDVDAVITRMKSLREIGVTFSLDDFGTGYSSLSHLNRLPLHQLKIDQSFVRDLTTDQNAQAIARAIIGMAISLGMQVIAEGVETQEQFATLRTYGCHAFQGYLFGRPGATDALS